VLVLAVAVGVGASWEDSIPKDGFVLESHIFVQYWRGDWCNPSLVISGILVWVIGGILSFFFQLYEAYK
jgi:hypothetical protein